MTKFNIFRNDFHFLTKSYIKLRHILAIFLLITSIFGSCSKKAVSPLQHIGRQIILGNGGGFTGGMTKYYITDKGDVFRADKDDSNFIALGTISKTITKQYFNSFDRLKFSDLTLDEPGNRYYFLTMKNKDGVEHKIQWGRNELTDPSISIYYENIMAIIKKMNTQK